MSTYTEQDLLKAAAIDKWLKDNDQPRAWLAKKMGVASSTLGQVINCKYPSSPSEMLDHMGSIITVEMERMGDGTPGYVEGSVHKLVFVVCDRTRKHANFGVIVGSVGVGKTRTLKEYKARKHQTLLVEANPNMTPGSLLIELLDQIGAAVPPGLDRKFQAIVKALAGTNHMLLVDEAETMTGLALEYLRRIRDKAGVGVVLVGTTKLHAMIKPEHGQFNQIRSRVSMWPETIKAITRDDCDEIARAAFSDVGEVPDEVLEALWDYSAGSARVLVESLVPSVKEYMGKHALSVALVEKVAKVVLNRHSRTGGAA